MSSLIQPRKTPGRGARNSHPASAEGIVEPRAGKMGEKENKDPNPVWIPKILQGSGLSREPKGKEESKRWKTNKGMFPEVKGWEKRTRKLGKHMEFQGKRLKGKEESKHWKTNKGMFPEVKGWEKATWKLGKLMEFQGKMLKDGKRGLGSLESTWNSKGRV
ncbi:hypothetical protein HGM15179_017745 [Zosterops borbonicus]|uniref:Uncharacterized protein n=1 Tax=Zosterops borbonicus TaxID=364589 RepID=A0A8K1G0C9_9PASS|nr:hypothetical protein HGM15179_017745 [Zosterops borbonicus]